MFGFGRAHSGCVEEAGERASDEAGDDVLAGKLAITLAMILTTRRQGEGRGGRGGDEGRTRAGC